MMTRERFQAAYFAIFVVGLNQAGAGELPSNARLVAAMPDDVEAVMVMRAADLLAEGSALRKEFQRYFGIPGERDPEGKRTASDIACGSDEDDLDQVVFREILDLKPLIRVLGGSNFQEPQGLGLGPFRKVSVWVTEDSNTGLREKLGNGNGITSKLTRSVMDGTDVFSAPIIVEWFENPESVTGETVFVAFPTENISIITWSEAQIREFVSAWKRKAIDVPERWRSAATAINVEAPLVILRKYGGPTQTVRIIQSEKPPKVELHEVAVDNFALAVVPGTAIRFHLRYNTGEPETAVHLFYGQTFTGGFTPSEWKWERKSDASGFGATVEFQQDKASHHHSGFMLLTLFGVNIAI